MAVERREDVTVIHIRSWADAQHDRFSQHRVLLEHTPKGLPLLLVLYALLFTVCYGILCAVPLVGEVFKMLFFPWGVVFIVGVSCALSSTWRPCGRTPVQHLVAFMRFIVHPSCVVCRRPVFPQPTRWSFRAVMTLRPGMSWPDLIPSTIIAQRSTLVRFFLPVNIHTTRTDTRVVVPSEDVRSEKCVETVRLKEGEILAIQTQRRSRFVASLEKHW